MTLLGSTPRGRLTAVAAVTVAAALALSGCSRAAAPSSDSSASSAAIDEKPATGTVTLWAPDGDATALKTVLADYRKQNPDLDLQVTLIPSDQYNTKLQTAISSDTAPDIAQVYTEAQSQFLASKAFAPVPSGLVDPASFFAGAWDAGKYEGATYSVPWYAYTRVLIYRKDLAEKGGVTAPKTWSESAAFYKGLEAGGAKTGLGGEVGWDTYTGQSIATTAYQAGASLLSSDGTKWDLDSSAFISALEYASAPFRDGTAAVDTPQFLDAQPYLVSGKTGSMISGPWVISGVDTVAKQKGWASEHLQTAVLPAGSASGVGALAGGSWAVSASSKNATSAWKVVREMAQEPTQVAQFKAIGSMPAVQAAWKDDAIAGDPLYDAFFDQLKTVRTYPAVSTWDQVSTAIGKEAEAVARGTETAAEAAKKIQAQADSIGTGN